LRDFDLVAVNSGGSFTLRGLIENFTLQDLLSNFFLSETKRKAVFSPVSFWEQVRNAPYDLAGIAPPSQTSAIAVDGYGRFHGRCQSDFSLRELVGRTNAHRKS
jgi:hypothetical protein